MENDPWCAMCGSDLPWNRWGLDAPEIIGHKHKMGLNGIMLSVFCYIGTELMHD